MVQQYLDHVREILTSPYTTFKGGSKGSGIISLFGPQREYDLREGVPLITTKEMNPDSVVHELVWFMNGDTNIKYLEDNGVWIWRRDAFQHNVEGMVEEGVFDKRVLEKYTPDWEAALKEYGTRIREDDEFAKRFGDAGPIYGKQWRRWEHVDENGESTEVDQLGGLIKKMGKNPTSKKLIVTAWNPGDVPRMSLPACHTMFQANSDGQGNFDLKMYQRSADMFLGVPYNVFSYAAAAQVFARETGLIPRRFIHTFGDSHLYAGLEKRSGWYAEHFDELRERVRAIPEEDRERYLEVLDWINKGAPRDGNEEKYDHVTAVLEQMSRESKKKPRLVITDKPFEELIADDFVVEGYEHHPAIRRKMAV